MAKFRYKVDLSHAKIRDGLRKKYPVWDCAMYGFGFPDLLVLVEDKFVLFEVKSKGEGLTHFEQKFFAKFPKAPLYVVYTLKEAQAIIDSLE